MKASIPQGTRDFSPLEMKRRTYMFSVLKKAFRLYGFDQIETPSFENASTLLGKYGDEGDRLIFKILNNGDFLKKADQQFLDEKNSKKLTKQICDRALRYDLTVPFARYVVQHRNDITMPFKRFQIQNVWRADRPQKGRYREFYQCDADVIGSTALQHEVELIQLYDAVFSEFNLLTVIKINNRKVLSAIAELANISDRLTEFTVILDKLDKIGKSGVVEQLNKNEFPTFAIQYIEKFLDLEGDNATMLSALSTLISDSEIGKKGLEELQEVVSQVEKFGLDSAKLQLDFTLARGLDYYTGT
ncbi:MAG: histidine--tRNA ligase, partial [Flavobacteriales bacterium]